MLKLALIDDYAHVALQSADWSRLDGKAEITVFDRHLTEEEAARELAPFDVICTIRERMAFPRTLLERLPNLKLITIIGMRLTNLDLEAATERGRHRRPLRHAQPGVPQHRRGDAGAELGPADRHRARHLAAQDRRMRDGLWQTRWA